MTSTRESNRWRPTTSRSALQLGGTLMSYLLLCAGAYLASRHSWPAGLTLAVLAGLALVRVFVLQHDCAHRSLFRRARTNDWVGTVLGFVTLAPHAYWRSMHLVHHSTSGNLDRRGVGDIPTMTVEEYRSLTPLAQARYRLLRHPAVLLGVAPLFQFLVRFRLPGIVSRERLAERRSIALTNAAVAILYFSLIVWGELPRWMILQVVTFQVAAGIGIWLFYVQHQVERPYWVRQADWSLEHSALLGSSQLTVPRPLEYLLASINLHHAHHRDPRVPNYRLRQYMADHGFEEEGVKMGLGQAMRTFRLKVYDETTGRMTGFPTRAQRRASPHPAVAAHEGR